MNENHYEDLYEENYDAEINNCRAMESFSSCSKEAECYFADSFDFKNTWVPMESLGKISKKDDPEYFVEVTVKEFNGKQYLVFVKHRPWKEQDRPLALPIEFADGFMELFKRLNNGSWKWPKKECNVRR